MEIIIAFIAGAYLALLVMIYFDVQALKERSGLPARKNPFNLQAISREEENAPLEQPSPSIQRPTREELAVRLEKRYEEIRNKEIADGIH